MCFYVPGLDSKPTTKIVNIGIQFWDNLKFHTHKSLVLIMEFNDWNFRLYQYCFDLSITGLRHCLALCIHDCLFNQISYLSMYIFMVIFNFFIFYLASRSLIEMCRYQDVGWCQYPIFNYAQYSNLDQWLIFFWYNLYEVNLICISILSGN